MATFIRPVTDNQICVYNLTVRESARSLNRSLNTTSPLGRLQVRGSLLFQLDVDVSAFAIVLVLNASITPMCAFTSCEVHRELWCVLTVGALSICMPLADRLEGCVNLRELTAGEVSINREKYIASSLTASSTSFYVSNPPVRLRSTVRRSLCACCIVLFFRRYAAVSCRPLLLELGTSSPLTLSPCSF